MLLIQGLPGSEKRRRVTIPLPHDRQNTGSRCKICQVIYLSPRDIKLKKEKKREWTWLGCEIPNCQYWAHAFCVNVKIKKQKQASRIRFMCPAHKAYCNGAMYDIVMNVLKDKQKTWPQGDLEGKKL